MNGLATLLAPPGGMPEVMGMAGRPPGTAEKSMDADGFLGILQQLIGGSVQMASLLSMLPVLPPQTPDGGGDTPAQMPELQGTPVPVADQGSGVATEQPGSPTPLLFSPPGPSPPGNMEVDLPLPTPTASVPHEVVQEQPVSPVLQNMVATPPQEAAATEAARARSGRIALPVGLEPVPDETVRELFAGKAPQHAAPALAAEDSPPVQGAATEGKAGKPHPAVPDGPVAQPVKTVLAGKLFPSLLLRNDRKVAADAAPRHNGDADAAPDLKTDRQPEQVTRTVRLPEGEATRAVTPQPDVAGKAEYAAHAAPVQIRAEAADEETPVTARTDASQVRGEEIPARAVVAAQPALESAQHDGEGSKNGSLHLQPQVAVVKPQAARAEIAASRLADLPVALPQETTRSVIDQVVKEAALRVQGETSEMRIRLVPASLGEVTLNVRMEGGQLQAQIDVSHAAVKAALEVNISQLRDALSSRGIDVQRLDVYHHGQSSAHDTGSRDGARYRRQGGRRHTYAADAVEQYATGRQMGYNTMEMVM